MASKHKQKSGQKKATVAGGGGAGLRLEAERLIAKGHLKDAVKQAKLCYRQESTPEHHRLLERAYYLRADQLRRNGMPGAAQEVAQHLLDFGLADPELVEETARLLLALGMTGDALKLQQRVDSPEARERFVRQAADQAVRHPGHVPGSLPEVRQGALQIRSALEALEAGDEARALDAVRDVSRGSPFADWKLFVRGLAAFFRRQPDEARANWERLDPDRDAARIAGSLLALNAPEGRSSEANLEPLERLVFGEPILAPLEQMRSQIAQDRWDEAVRQVATLRQRLWRLDPGLSERLTRVLYDPLIRAASQLGLREAQALIGNFTRVAEPLPLDPRWNRLWALLWEGPQGDLDVAEEYWRKYLDDLKDLPALPREQRPQAQALIWAHLGRQYLEQADEEANIPFGPKPSDREIDQIRRLAVSCLEESLRLCPTHREAYRDLLEAYDDWKWPEPAAATARRLLEVFPDDFETAMYLARYHFRRDEAARALEYALRARALKPLDEGAAQEEWAARVALARQRAGEKRWDEGRAEFAAAERAWPAQNENVHYLARKAVFELKAGQPERAEALIAEAQTRLVEPAPLWLALLIEAIRYHLPKADRDRFEVHWLDALPKKVRGETAAALADLLTGFLAGDIRYPRREEHVRQVVDYLRRTTRIKYRQEDLARVCGFLGLIPKERDLFETLIKRGLKLFPRSALFLMLAGTTELQKGPLRGDLKRARGHYEKALELAQASSEPRDQALLPKIKESLSMLQDLTTGPLGLPLPGAGGGPPPDFIEMIEAMADELGVDTDELFESEFEDEPEPVPTPRRFPFGFGRKRKKG